MKKILAFGGSNSKNSINKVFASYTAQQIDDTEVTIIDLNDFEMPLYSIDLEKEQGVPQEAEQFAALIEAHDAIILSLAEHNSNVTAAFKNLTDWVSRLPGKTWRDSTMLLLSTSPGGRGGVGAINVALNSFPYSGANIVAHFSLPSYGKNFSTESGITDPELKDAFEKQIKQFKEALFSS